MNCTQDDRARREIIKQIMCNGFVSIDTDKYSEEINQLSPFVDDNLIEIITNQAMTDLRLTDDGRFLSRNIASCFDIYLRKSSGHKVFSKAL
jgi:coproporphyrinogen III oxidase-like Fe-S oxidoreductase